jgi:hypothetical protein
MSSLWNWYVQNRGLTIFLQRNPMSKLWISAICNQDILKPRRKTGFFVDTILLLVYIEVPPLYGA